MFHTFARTLLLSGLLTAALAGGTPVSATYTCYTDAQGGCVSNWGSCDDEMAYGVCLSNGDSCRCYPF